MAKPNPDLIEKLREAAAKIETGADYSWGHVGRCNCGHLAQCITPLSASEIYKRANSQILEEWSEYARDYCPSSGAPMDMIMDAMFAIGLQEEDIRQLEYLSNKEVLKALPGGFRYLEKGKREDAALYMRTWAGLLESELLEKRAFKGFRRAESISVA